MNPKFKIGDKVIPKGGLVFEVEHIVIYKTEIHYYTKSGTFWHEESLALYTEPKPKVKKYLWAYVDKLSKHQMVSMHFFKNEKEFKDFYGFKSWFQRLDWSMIEVDE